jgi:hypothetical protein
MKKKKKKNKWERKEKKKEGIGKQNVLFGSEKQMKEIIHLNPLKPEWQAPTRTKRLMKMK